MREFMAKHQDQIAGTLSGFDRLVFRGTLRWIAHDEGMKRYLWANQVMLKDFGAHVERVSRRLKAASLAEAEALGRPVKYLTCNPVSQEEMARGIAAEERIHDGLVCVLSCVEPCWSFEIHRNREKKRLELEPRYRKCLFLYHYWMHPVFGFMNARIQTWFPFPVQVCLNGREWLARRMDAAGLEYARQDNCFPWIADWAKAQRLMDRQLRANWPKLLDGVAKQLDPIHGEIFQKHPVSYYWSTYRSEWAIDIAFRETADLRRLYPRLVHHGMTTFSSVDEDTTLEELIRRLGQPKQWRGRRVRALRPFADDSALAEAVSRGEFAINGFRNRNLRAIFFPRAAKTPQETRSRSAWVSRKLRLLRAHGLITKTTGTHRYQLTVSGRKATTAIRTALRSTVRQLSPLAA